MRCWCDETLTKCLECESKEKFNKLSDQDKKQCIFLLKEIQKDNATHFLRNEINQFEEKHDADITEFYYRGVT